MFFGPLATVTLISTGAATITVSITIVNEIIWRGSGPQPKLVGNEANSQEERDTQKIGSNFRIRKKYLDLISDSIISQTYMDSSRLLSELKKNEFPDFADSYDQNHVPTPFVIMDNFFTYIFEKEQEDRKGVWTNRLIGFLNSEIMWISSEKIEELRESIPPREIEKVGITFSK